MNFLKCTAYSDRFGESENLRAQIEALLVQLKPSRFAQNYFSDFWTKFGPYPKWGGQIRSYGKLWDTKA